MDGAAATIHQLLAFARTGTVSEELRPLELRAWLERTWAGLRLAVPASITSRLELPPEGTWVRADAAALQQALTNLVYNARDALEGRPGGTLAVSCGVLPAAGEAPARAYLRVADDGPGVPPELKERIFAPFFTTKPEGRGSGLGLAMVKEAVRRHGGALRVEDGAAGGATFEVLLPVAGPGASPEVPVAERPRGRGELVLLADDHRPFRATARLLLESLGYRVLEAADGREAVELFTRSPDVRAAVLDVLMPNLNGPEAAAQLHALRPEVPVLFATAFDDGELARQDLPPGSEVLSKPFQAEELAQRLRRALERTAPPARAAAASPATTAH